MVIKTCFSLVTVYNIRKLTTFVQALYGLESSQLKTKEFPILKMNQVIWMDVRAHESHFTVELVDA